MVFFIYIYFAINTTEPKTHTQHSISTQSKPIQLTTQQIHKPPFTIHTRPQQNPPQLMSPRHCHQPTITYVQRIVNQHNNPSKSTTHTATHSKTYQDPPRDPLQDPP